jgi:hypothetical protein
MITVVDDEKNLEQVMALYLLGLLYLCAEHSLHDDAPEGRRVLTTKDITTLLNISFFIIFNVGGAIPIFYSNVCPLTRAILMQMTKSLAAVALNRGRASC